MEVDNAGFSDLLQQAEQLTAEMDGDTELPRVERNLRQILDAGQQLWSRTTQAVSKDTSDVKASILLGSKGYDLPRISQKLEGLSAVKTFEPIEPIRETDIQGFLKNERENAMLSVIEESKKSTFERADRMFWETMESEWEQEKQKILNALMGPSQELLDVSLDIEPTLCESVDMRTRSAMDGTEMAYGKEMYLYNEEIVQGGLKYNLAEKFYDLFEKMADQKLMDLWEMVKFMTDVPLKTDKDIVAMRNSLQMQTAFIRQARKYLEKKYLQYIETVVYGNLHQAELGGIPGTYYLVRSFLKIRYPVCPSGLEDGLIEGNPIWAVIYYCLRCGDVGAAVEAARNAGVILGDFLPFLTEYMENEDHRLSTNCESQIKLQYRRSVRSSTDPFKKAVYCVLACDISDDNSEIANKTDDYLWLKLCQLRPEEEDTALVQQDKMTFSRLQTVLLEEFGESHFQAYQQPLLYFQVLFLTAQFEAAIEFLSRVEQFRCHAVHVAIVLYELNLLALSQSHHAPLLSKVNADKPPMRRLNLSRLIIMYTRKFEATDPREAIQYFYVLRDIRGARGSVFMSCVSELVLETKEFEMLLGKVEPDGCRKPGIIDKFHGDTQGIIEIVASDSESKGQYEDAIKLYDLAKKHEKVLEILNKLLSQVVPLVSSLGSTRQRLESLAFTIAERYKSQGHNATRETTGTFYLLLDLMTFFNMFHNNQLSDALDTMKKLKLLPFETEEVEEKVNSFSLYSEEIRRNLPDVLLATMNLLYTDFKKAKSAMGLLNESRSRHEHRSVADNIGQEEYIAYLRSQARALITYAGMIPYRMPGDTNARLVQIEVLMN